MNIQVPKGDPVFDPTATGKVFLPFQRGPWDKESGQSPSNPRTQVLIIDSCQRSLHLKSYCCFQSEAVNVNLTCKAELLRQFGTPAYIVLKTIFICPKTNHLRDTVFFVQVNSVTAWIDGSSIYGPSSSWSDSLRSFSGGLLVSGSEWNLPKQGRGRNFMWSAADPSTQEHGPQGLYGETLNPSDSHSSIPLDLSICQRGKKTIELTSAVAVI